MTLNSLPLAVALFLSWSTAVRSAAIPIAAFDTPTPTAELLPYNADTPGASPRYVPKAPAVLLPLAEVLPFVGAADFPLNSRLGQVVAALPRLGPIDQLVNLDDASLVSMISSASSGRSKRQLCGLFGNCPKPSASSTSIAAQTKSTQGTSTAAAQGGCGLLGLQPCPPKTTSQTLASSAATSSTPSASTSSAPAPSSTVTCIGSGQTEQTINTLLSAGGAGTTVYLCQSAVINIKNPIQFTAAKQTLITRGAPTDGTRATIVVTGLLQSTAILSSCTACSGVAIRNIQVNGNRPAMGYVGQQLGGSALIEAGGSNQDQVIDNVRAYEPRSWSTLHAMEGTNNICSGMRISNNQLGPAGQPPSNPSNQLQGEWADGISLGCQKANVTGNTIVDATDGGIVIFGSPGSLIQGNTVLQQKRQVMGGINMVDTTLFGGSYEGVIVAENTFNAESSFIKVGIAMGPNVWGSNNVTSGFTHGGTVRDNVFTAGSGYFGWSIGIAGHTGATLSGNSLRGSNFAGVPSKQCTAALPPTPQPFVIDLSTSPANTIAQGGFSQTSIQLLICEAPSSAMTRTGLTTSY